jgi:hypothetical protein
MTTNEPIDTTREWSAHSSTCRFCGEAFRVSVEYIDDVRENDPQLTDTDEEIASGPDICLECAYGVPFPGEKPQKISPTWRGPVWQLAGLTPMEVRHMASLLENGARTWPEWAPLVAKIDAMVSACRATGVYPTEAEYFDALENDES